MLFKIIKNMKAKTEKEFRKENIELLKNYELIKFNGMKNKSIFKCSKHGLINKTPANFINHQCNECTKEKLREMFLKSNDDYIKEAKEIFPEYDFSKTEYKGNDKKIIVIYPKHKEFKIEANSLLQGHGCKLCANEEISKMKTYSVNELIQRANKVHNYKYDYSLSDKNGISSKVKINCPTHGIFTKSWNNHINQHQGCPECNGFFGEVKTKEWLVKNNIEFVKNKPFEDLKDIDYLKYDFYIEKINLLIEIQGQQHYYNSFNKPIHEWHRQLHHDWLKRKYAKNFNFLTIPYWEFKNINKILERKINELL